MIIPLLVTILTVHVHAGSNPGSKDSSPFGSPKYGPVCHVPLLEDDLNLPCSAAASTSQAASVPVKIQPPYGHMYDAGRGTPTGTMSVPNGNEMLKIPKGMKAKYASLFVATSK